MVEPGITTAEDVMKKVILAAALVMTMASVAAADTYVKGYTKSDGTYVQGHYRSSPNAQKFDNYSSQGQTNPYTGQKGTQPHEFSSPYDQKNYNYGR